MAADGGPYGVPLSFGDDCDDHLYFPFLGPSTELRKVASAEQSDRVSFTAFDVESDGSWRSVIVEGPLERITPKRWDTAREALADTAYESDLFEAYEIQENPKSGRSRSTTGRGVLSVSTDQVTVPAVATPVRIR